MSRSNRLFEIIQILRSATGVMTASQLAEKLEVTTRTVYRDIAVLQSRGVPIDGEAGIGYLMRAGYDLPPLMFDAEEIEALIVGLRLIKRTGDEGLIAASQRVADKLYEILPEQRSEETYAAPLVVSSFAEMPDHQIDVAQLRESIRAEKALWIDYRDAAGNVTDRTLYPIAMIYYIDALILVAWCQLRSGFRHFRVDRIQSCENTEASFSGQGDKLRLCWREQHELPS
ncbi:hypothetical protein AB833_10740 [Chromatiales bacterium (ex Bugula neritina AB1)]|nr:hypothetical protein AB833_10740 [Chromatiales bacterium (ex Bugula neritina AB1)]